MPDTSQVADLEQTEVGSYFVANYPPFSVWTPDAVATDARVALALSRPRRRRRWGCTCTSLFAVSAVISATSGCTPTRTRKEVEQYLDLLAREWELYAGQPAHCRAALQLRVLRRRHALVSVDPPARDARQAADGEPVVGDRRGDHVRVRARDASLVPSWRRSAASASRGSASASRISAIASSS